MHGSSKRSLSLKSQSNESEYEDLFMQYWCLLKNPNYPDPVRQYRFDPKRRWRLDFAWVKERVALEIDGGIWVGLGHSTGAGSERDREKGNALALQGWSLLRYSTTTLERNPQRVIDEIQHLLNMRL